MAACSFRVEDSKEILRALNSISPLVGAIPSVMIIEMFLQSSRSAAFMVGGSVHWLSNFTVGLVFDYMKVRKLSVHNSLHAQGTFMPIWSGLSL